MQDIKTLSVDELLGSIMRHGYAMADSRAVGGPFSRRQVNEELERRINEAQQQNAELRRLQNENTILREALKPLVSIANAYDDDALDQRSKTWTTDTSQEHWKLVPRPPDQIELYNNRGGRMLLSLKHCLDAREAVKEKS